MTQARAPRQFGSTEHLASEAIAAYVDGELRMYAYLRASHHLSICAECAVEVDSQQQARRALRRSGEVDDAVRSPVVCSSQIPTLQPGRSRRQVPVRLADSAGFADHERVLDHEPDLVPAPAPLSASGPTTAVSTLSEASVILGRVTDAHEGDTTA